MASITSADAKTANHDRLDAVKQWAKACFALFTLASILWNAWQISAMWFQAKDIVAVSRALPRTGIVEQIDYLGTMAELSRRTSFWQTFGWWHQTFAGNVPFWRPLTSQAWWLEAHIFGYDRLDKWQWVTVISHLLVVALLVTLVKRLTGRWSFGLLAALVYAGSRQFWPLNTIGQWIGGVPANIALGEWKYQQDVWAAAALLGCLVLTYDRRWIGALLCAFIAVCFKESGWASFPLAFFVLIAGQRLKETPFKVYIWTFCVIVLLVALRASAGSAVMRGYDIGTNQAWASRYLHAVGGTFLNLLDSASCASALLGASILGIVLWRRGRFLLRAALAILAIAVAAGMLMISKQSSYLEGLEMLFDPSQETLNVALSGLWLWLAYSVLRDARFRRLAVCFTLMTLLCTIFLVAATQVQIHVMYLAYLFDSTVVALALIAAVKSVWKSKHDLTRP